MKIAFLFAGQGAQYAGMGRELFQVSKAAREVFHIADEIRIGTSEQCFNASKETLSLTINTQPCVFAVELAAAYALMENGIAPYAVAGFSLGEVAALTFSGALTLRDGFRVIQERAQLMQKAAQAAPSGMAAALGLSGEQVEKLCEEFEEVYAVNYNCPGQIVVSGEKAALMEFCAKVAEQGGKTMALAVNGGFHSPLMADAAKKLAAKLLDYTFYTPKYPVFANTTARPYAPPFDTMLAEQVKKPVLWQKTIEALIEYGADTFIELGPGKTLCGFMKKIAPNIKRVYHVQDEKSLQHTLAALQERDIHA